MSFRRRIAALRPRCGVAVAAVSIVTYVLVRNELRDRVDTELRRDVTETFDVPLLARATRRRSRSGAPRTAAAPSSSRRAAPGRRRRPLLPSGPLGGPSVYAQLVDADGP